MAVLCCYTTHNPAADGKFHLHSSWRASLDSIEQHAPSAVMVNVTGDDFAYWREISARWHGTENMVIIEHDMIARSGMVQSLEECSEDWCAYEYDIFGCKRLANALGFTKFSAHLQRTVTAHDVMTMFSACANCHGLGCWWHLDNYIAAALDHAGFTPHVHGVVEHMHDYTSPGTIPLCEGVISVYSWDAGNAPKQFHIRVPAALREVNAPER